MITLDLEFEPTLLLVARLGAFAPVPPWADVSDASFLSITRTRHELSIVAPAAIVPAGMRAEGPFVSFRVAGPLPFGLVGIIAALVEPLAAAGVPVFVVSTFETDWVLVDEGRGVDAWRVLSGAGHRVGLG